MITKYFKLIKQKNKLKKLTILIMVFALGVGAMAQQDEFVRKYDSISQFDYKTEKWSAWSPADFTIVFNLGDNHEDILILYDGNTTRFYPVGKKVLTGTLDGVKYQSMKYMSDIGENLELILFNNGVTILSFSNNLTFKLSPKTK